MSISKAMERRLASRSAIRESFELAHRLASQGRAVFDFSLGNPSAPCPEGVSAALEEALVSVAANPRGYMESAGYERVRRVIADSLNRDFGGDYRAGDIVMTTGAACAINLVFQALLDPGDEVVVFAPYYPAYEVFIEQCGATMVVVPFQRDSLLPDCEAFADLLGPRVKIVLVNSPNNPSGLVYPAALAARIADIMRDARQRSGADVMLLSDEPYRDLVYDGQVNPWWPDYYDDVSVVYSFSKSASLAGERIGYLAVSPQAPDHDDVIRAACRALGDAGFVNAPATAQLMAAECARRPSSCAAYYDTARRLLFDGLHAAGFDPVYPNGAFYLLLPAPDGDDSRLFALLADEGIISVEGSEFGCPGYVRLSFCMPASEIPRALPSFRRVARSYGLEPRDGGASRGERTSG